ncbi:Cog4 domain-containing protein [Mycena indigotica]|uniref:Conserved oligomeric Golgi complex subunit 4 n=1 Tax=Mycena indigotica TaxID=2126181 RepID=A0A8H6SA84_9AGAR|nr:Cog4 domain-containing protein [Mycena indigotica]KAF7295237.1 Cog4 domain-containing protein [Mycena indigotica]
MRSPRSTTSLQEILSSISEYQSEEAQLSNSLSELLSAREPIVASLARLQSLIPSLDTLTEDATLLSRTVSATATTAERVGGRVRSLDEEMRRVREAADRVGQVMELKTSLSALQSAIQSQDWEAATRHCARAMSLPIQVISGPFAETAVPTSDSHLPPAQTLQAAREHLLTIFRQQFEQASRSRDSATTSRFFKLFPEIGWEEEGLQAYAAFIVDLVRVRAPASAKTSSPLYYITALTALFESIALIVDQHQPVVEKYYGKGKMQRVVVRLLEECDRVVKGIIEGWDEERSVQRRLTDVSEHPPVTLNQSTRSKPQGSTLPDEDLIDPREIDRLCSETAGMAGRWNLFKKFLSESLKDDNVDEDDDKTPEQVESPELVALQSTASQTLFEDLLRSRYIPFEVWYTRTTIDKAHRLSSPDTSQSPVTTTTPDDVFYILKTVVSRLLSTGSLNAVEKMFQQLRDILEKDYVGVIKKKLEDVYRTSGPTGPNAQKQERDNRTAFIILLNDLDLSVSHLERLTRDVMTSPTITQHFLVTQQTTVKEHITVFANISAKIRSALRSGIEQLFNQLLRPKLRTLTTEVYKDVSYVLDEDAYAAAEYQDVVRKRFVKAWESLVDGYKDNFTDSNYRLFFGLALDVVLRPWEKFMMGLRFTELGAIRFDRDLRAITTYLSSQTAFGDAREKFLRLQQFSTIINLDADEDVDEFYNGSGITWKLSAQEARAVAALKL